jgi:hypothetical protein
MPPTLKDLAVLLLPRLGPGRALATRERTTLEHVVEVFLEGAPVDITRERAAENIERFLIAGRSRRAWRVRVLLTAIELSSLPTDRRLFSRLPLAARAAIVRERWASGRNLNRIYGKVRNLAILGIYGDPGAATATGYVPLSLRPRFRAVAAAAPVEVAAHEN